MNVGKINIRESKQRKDRTVMMSDDLTKLCRSYNSRIDLLLPKRTAFFPDSFGNRYSTTTFCNAFNDVWRVSGLQYRGEEKPTNYSFRHTFATHRLYKWMQEGKDLTAMLPNLSEYMGHRKLSSTYYYIHFVPGVFEAMSGQDYSHFQDLMPEVMSDE
ncbi:hypothetical protein FACS1894202_10930 [Clostridia bacterium]|nr:hypothetical protein FACS1894202_10930 [Clostridia bacterium]